MQQLESPHFSQATVVRQFKGAFSLYFSPPFYSGRRSIVCTGPYSFTPARRSARLRLYRPARYNGVSPPPQQTMMRNTGLLVSVTEERAGVYFRCRSGAFAANSVGTKPRGTPVRPIGGPPAITTPSERKPAGGYHWAVAAGSL